MDTKSIIGDYESFLDKVFSSLKEAGFNEKELNKPDHLAYRVETHEEYLKKKDDLIGFGELITENEINGRPISVIKLNEPIKYKNHSISCLELAAPSPAKFFKEGLEHVEFIIEEPFEELMTKYKDVDFSVKPDQLHPNLIIQFDNFAVKFIHLSLLKIAKIQEKNQLNNY